MSFKEWLGISIVFICIVTAGYSAWYHLIKYPNGKPKNKKT